MKGLLLLLLSMFLITPMAGQNVVLRKGGITMTSTRNNSERISCNHKRDIVYENNATYKNRPKYDFKNPKHSRKCICWTRNPKQGGPQSYLLNPAYPKGKWINEHFI